MARLRVFSLAVLVLPCLGTRVTVQQMLGTEILTMDTNETSKCPGGLTKKGKECTGGSVTFLHGGVINVQALMADSMAAAIQDVSLRQPVVDAVKQLWTNDKVTLKERWAHFKHTGHQLEEGMPAVHFIAEHGLEHVVIDLIVHALHAAFHGAAWVGALEVLGHALACPMVLGLQGLMVWVQVQHNFMKAWYSTSKIAVAMTQKFDCLSERLTFRTSDFFSSSGSTKPNLFNADVQKICPAVGQKELAQALLDANVALRSFFGTVGSVGRCLYPIGSGSAAKIKCIESIVPQLKISHGKMGLLYSGIALAIIHGKQVDDLLTNDKYGHHIQNIYAVYDVKKPQNIVPKLAAMSELSEGMQSLNCVSLIATQRAYAEAFVKLEQALQVWMRSYARDSWIANVQTTWYPCARIMNKLSDTKSGMCSTSTYPTNTRPRSVCTNAYLSRIWQDKKH